MNSQRTAEGRQCGEGPSSPSSSNPAAGASSFPVCSRAQVVGHEGTNGHLGGLIVVVIVDESLIAAGSSMAAPRQVPRQHS